MGHGSQYGFTVHRGNARNGPKNFTIRHNMNTTFWVYAFDVTTKTDAVQQAYRVSQALFKKLAPEY